MFQLLLKPSFKRDLKKYKQQGGNVQRVHEILAMLREGKELPMFLIDHQLTGKLCNYRELHVEHDRLIVYQRDGKRFILTCIWLVTHKKLKERERNL